MRADGSVPASFAEQAELTLQNLRACLAAHGLGLDAVVKLGVFVLPGQDFQALRAARERHFGAASTHVHERLRAAARKPGVPARDRGDRRQTIDRIRRRGASLTRLVPWPRITKYRNGRSKGLS